MEVQPRSNSEPSSGIRAANLSTPELRNRAKELKAEIRDALKRLPVKLTPTGIEFPKDSIKGISVHDLRHARELIEDLNEMLLAEPRAKALIKSAISIATSIKDNVGNSNRSKTRLLGDIAIQQAEAGLNAEPTIAMVLEELELVKSGKDDFGKLFQVEVLNKVLIAQNAAGLETSITQDAIVKIIAEINEDDERHHYKTDAINDYAHTLLAIGQPDQAYLLIDSIKDKSVKAKLLSSIALANVDIKNTAKAFDITYEIEYELHQVETLCKIAVAQTGDDHNRESIISTALKIAEKIKYSKDKNTALCKIAIAQAAIGIDPRQLLETVMADLNKKYYCSDYISDDSFQEVASAYAATGYQDLALEAMYKILSTASRNHVYSDIAIFQAHSGEFDAAFRTVKKMAYSQEEPLLEIAIAQAKSGLFSTALATTSQFKSTREVIKAYCEVAIAEAAAGVDPQSTLLTAMKMLKEDKYSFNDTNMLVLIANSQAIAAKFIMQRKLTKN